MREVGLAELTAFVEVARQRNFTKAAAKLDLARSTLSQTIRALESRLGVRLLNRSTRSVALTEAGDRLLAQLQPALQSVANAVEAVNAYRETPMGTLRLSVSRAAALHVIAPLISPFIAAYPDITIEIISDDSRTDIVRGRFDAGVRIGEMIEQDMITVRIADEFRMVTVASPSYLQKNASPAKPEDLRAHNCIRQRWGPEGIIVPWEFQRGQNQIDVAVEGRVVVNDMQLALYAAVAGAGIAYVPDVFARPYVDDKKLVNVLQHWSRSRSGVFLYYSGRRQVPIPLQTFISFVRNRQRLNASPP